MKIAVSIPGPLFEAAEKLATVRSMPRSRLYATALSDYISKQSDDEITLQLNQVYGNSPACLETGFAAAQLEAIGNESW